MRLEIIRIGFLNEFDLFKQEEQNDLSEIESIENSCTSLQIITKCDAGSFRYITLYCTVIFLLVPGKDSISFTIQFIRTIE